VTELDENVAFSARVQAMMIFACDCGLVISISWPRAVCPRCHRILRPQQMAELVRLTTPDGSSGNSDSTSAAFAVQSQQPIHRDDVPGRRARNDRVAGSRVDREVRQRVVGLACCW
jgi:hypothetical protein